MKMYTAKLQDETGFFKGKKTSQFTQILRRHSLIAGLVLMFLFTWPIDLAHSGVLPFQIPFGVYILLGWGLSLGALVMTGLTNGKEAVIKLIKRFLIWRVGWKWYLVAIVLLPAIFMMAVVLSAVVTQAPVDFSTVLAYTIFGPAARLPLLILPFFIFEAVTNGEEMGWRGYVLPKLQGKHSALAASLILGVIWGFWHLPKYLPAASFVTFAVYMVKTLAASVLYTWLYNNTKGSLLLVTLFHASGNTAGMFVPIANTVSSSNWTVFLLAAAIHILAASVVIKLAGVGLSGPNFPAEKLRMKLEDDNGKA